MENVKKRLPVINPDKLNHFFWGSVASYIGILFAIIFGLHKGLCAFLFGLVIGIAVEIYDKITKGGQVEFMDIVFTALSGTIYLLTEIEY